MMHLKTQDDLSKYVMCDRCNSLYRKVQLPAGKRARCKKCGAILYRYDPAYLDRALALAVSGIIFFVLANLFPLIRVGLWGKEHTLTLFSAISVLEGGGFYIVAIGVTLLVLVIPLLVIVDYAVLILLLKLGKRPEMARRLLVSLSHLIPWSMVDIFTVSVLIALVKLSGKVTIHFGVAFWALVIYAGIDLYLTRARRIGTLWEIYERRYHGQ